jgi:hypothetical protein
MVIKNSDKIPVAKYIRDQLRLLLSASMADKLLKPDAIKAGYKAFSFIATDAFLLNKKTEGKLSKNIYFPICFTA